MGHNSLASIAYARPVIYAEGLFASCYLDRGEFIPEEGISHTELWSILSGELFKSGLDLVEDYALKKKLSRLRHINSNTYELEQFPQEFDYTSSDPPSDTDDENIDNAIQRQHNNLVDGFPILMDNHRMLPNLRTVCEDSQFLPKESISKELTQGINLHEAYDNFEKEELRLRALYEQQVSWIMGEDGEEFVSMETFTRFTDALILLDVLKQFNVPSVVSFLARRDEPIALTFSKTTIGLDCLMFCLFQA